jgi:glycosyltransferase involved in cell wall biosynthesis
MQQNSPPFRILHIDTEFGWRGGQQQVAYLVAGMRRQGYETAVVCQPGSDMERYCRDHAWTCHPVRTHGELDFVAGYRVARLCREKKFDVLHLHAAHALALGVWAKVFRAPGKMVASRRVDFHIKKNWLSRFKYDNPYLDRIVCISDQIRKVLLSDGIPAHKLQTIHSGVDIHRFDGVSPPDDFRAQLGIPDDHILVGTMAAMADHKDYPNLLRAADMVRQRSANITFCAVGSGPEEARIHKLAEDLKLGDCFIFTGFRKDVGHFLKSYDIFVHASYLEGLGTSILDAQSVGLPIIATRTGGIPEIIDNEKTGILVPPRDSRSLADAICELAGDASKRRRLGAAGRGSVEAFSIENTVERNIQMYKALL